MSKGTAIGSAAANGSVCPDFFSAAKPIPLGLAVLVTCAIFGGAFAACVMTILQIFVLLHRLLG